MRQMVPASLVRELRLRSRQSSCPMQMLGQERWRRARPSWEEREQPPSEIRAWPRQARVQPQG